jgi:hypothetical protein
VKEKGFDMKIRWSVCAIAIALTANLPVFANNEATNTNTVSSTLAVNVNVVKAIRLTLTSGTQCSITAGANPPDFTMNFGTVDALGISNASCGSKYAPANPGSDPAKYYSDYKLTPRFTGQSAGGTITAYVSSDFATAAGLLSVVQSNALPSTAADLGLMSTNAASPTSIGTTLTNNVPITSYIGVSVAPINGSGTLTGAAAATVTYTLTAP